MSTYYIFVVALVMFVQATSKHWEAHHLKQVTSGEKTLTLAAGSGEEANKRKGGYS